MKTCSDCGVRIASKATKCNKCCPPEERTDGPDYGKEEPAPAPEV
jgi:hypothetical protein